MSFQANVLRVMIASPGDVAEERKAVTDDVVEQIAPAAAYPAFRNTVLPGALDGGLHGRDLQGAKGSGYFQTIFLVVIEEQEAGSGFVRKGFS